LSSLQRLFSSDFGLQRNLRLRKQLLK